MAFLLVVLVTGLALSPALAQWSDTGPVYTQDNVGIGTDSPSRQLAVNGTIRAKEVLVQSENWPDFVFADGYDLPTLPEVAAHISAEGHLPGVPSAASVETDGVRVGAMQATLLQKIEELTLYAIERDEEVQAMQATLQELTQTVETQQAQIERQREQIKHQQRQIDALLDAVGAEN